MPFNFLLANQLQYGTKINESGVNVSIDKKRGETVLFFRLDSGDNRRLLKYLDIGDTGRICDLLIYYLNENDDKPSIFLVELKGKKTSDAIAQIESVYDAFSKKLTAEKIFDDFKWGAFIKTNSKSPVPKNNKQLLDRLRKKGLTCRTIKKDEADFIRNIL